MSYTIDRAKGFLHSPSPAQILPKMEASFNRTIEKINFMDLPSEMIEKIFTTLLDRDLCKLSSTNRRWNRITASLLDDRWKKSYKATPQLFPYSQSRMYTRNVCREAFRSANSEAIASTSQRINCLLQSLTYIDSRELAPMVEECPELRSLFYNPTSFLHNLLFDHPLIVVWQELKKQNFELNLPNFRTANAIRQWIKTKEAKQIFSQIKELNLSCCNLSVLPPEIGQLAALQELRLWGNHLISLPLEIGQLAALKMLDVRGNQLVFLPPEVGQLAALQVLRLGENQLASLPLEIGQLTALRVLYLDENQLISLPATIGQLAALQKLYLDGNKLTSLPFEIGQLAALQALFLMENQLTSIPAGVGRLAALKMLDIRGNPQLAPLPVEIEYKERNQELYILRLVSNI